MTTTESNRGCVASIPMTYRKSGAATHHVDIIKTIASCLAGILSLTLIDRWKLDRNVMREDLTNERPLWPLSCYGPTRFIPKQLMGGPGIEQSPEETRVLFYLAKLQGNEQAVVGAMNRFFDTFTNFAQAQNEFQLAQSAQSQVDNILSNLNEACRYIWDGQNEHPNRIDITAEPNKHVASAVDSAQQKPNPFSNQPGAFEQAKPNPFAAPDSASKPNPFSQPPQAQSQPNPFQQPSAPFPSSQPATGFSSGGLSTPFNQQQQPSKPNPFAQQNGPLTTNAFAQPVQSDTPNQFSSAPMNASPFSQPTISTPNPFGQPQTAQQSFAQPVQQQQTPFGQPQQATPQPFGQPPQQQLGQPALGPPKQNPFGQPPSQTQSQQPGPFSAAPPQPAQTNGSFGAGAIPLSATSQSRPSTRKPGAPPFFSRETPFANSPDITASPEAYGADGSGKRKMLENAYRKAKETGRFDGPIPEEPPLREWCQFDF